MTSTNTAAEKPVRFRCNICGAENECPASTLQREVASCTRCGSTVRTRAIVRMLSLELFGVEMALPDFPVLKGLRAIGMSDSADYAGRLAEKFDYRNTEYDREPRLDIVHPEPSEFGRYDFIMSSEVLEHVVAPVDVAFSNLYRMLKPDGVLLLTVPYKPAGDTTEHFGPMHDFGLARVGDRTVLVDRTASGEYRVFDDLVFHGGPGSTLEMRVFSEQDLLQHIKSAGFTSVEIQAESSPSWGVVHAETWSLPIAARKGGSVIGRDAIRSWANQWMALAGRCGSLEATLAETQRRAQQDLDAAYSELKSRTEWAQRLDRELLERTRWASDLERQLQAARAASSPFRRSLWMRIARRLLPR